MRFYVGVTDFGWFRFLGEQRPDEVNFWRPSSKQPFRAIEPGAPFLFKLHSPRNFIVGGGFFVRYAAFPLSFAWEAFGAKNGTPDLPTLQARIASYRRDGERDPEIGCIVLTEPFFLEEKDWIPAPADWKLNIVAGKGYDSASGEGLALWAAVRDRLVRAGQPLSGEPLGSGLIADGARRYGSEFLTRARLGQGGFRVLVTDTYQRRCALTGERTLPALQAAHIKPYAKSGPHSIDNGLLMRADLHLLFDRGYISVTPDHVIEVSRRIREEFENGRDYYRLHGGTLVVRPEDQRFRPSPDYLRWHNENLFRG